MKSFVEKITTYLSQFANFITVSPMSDGDACVHIDSESMKDYLAVRNYLDEMSGIYIVGDSAVYNIYVSPVVEKEVPSFLEEIIQLLEENFNAKSVDVPFLQSLFRKYAELKGLTGVKRETIYGIYKESVEEFTKIGWGHWKTIFDETKDKSEEIGEYVFKY